MFFFCFLFVGSFSEAPGYTAMTGPFPRHRQLGPTKIHLLLLLLVTCSVSFVDAGTSLTGDRASVLKVNDRLEPIGAECDSCTLTVMCWIGGGQREEGCSGPSWLVTCCVPQVTRSDDDDDDDGSNDARAVASPSALTLQQFPLLQPPRASNIVGGLRSASGSNPFPQQLAPLANTLVEEIANFGRNECKWPWQLDSTVLSEKPSVHTQAVLSLLTFHPKLWCFSLVNATVMNGKAAPFQRVVISYATDLAMLSAVVTFN
jgi:hypothetical protein